ncbi:SH2 domain-containing protein 7-like [Lampris incognitus]|uniref:SH2 domain-containing protein 7-like n=1 Tax=Lampris incognitus TaxID=2546036 RepID=UPI0024B5767C|nr:SH2 domain-containing protein 7-like [Lampris incognitus]
MERRAWCAAVSSVCRDGGRMEAADGGLKELVLRWFTETQSPLLLPDGSFPDWFQGFTSRREAEDLLRDKTLGCFLIRLSEKAIGYILSYKGEDRCRHFVINQSQDGRLAVSGDCQTHRSLAELIEHYRLRPIQPFGEHLTCCWSQNSVSDLYDVVKLEAKEEVAGVSVQALRTIWDQKSDQTSERTKNQKVHHPPALPPKTRKLTGSVSVGATSPSQVLPPVPKRGLPLSHSLSECLPERSSTHSQDQQHTHADTDLRPSPSPAPVLDDSPRGENIDPSDHSGLDDVTAPSAMYSELMLQLMLSRSKSLPRLDKHLEEEFSNQLSIHSSRLTSDSPTPLKRATCQTYSLHEVPRDDARLDCGQPDHQNQLLKSNPLYQSSPGPEDRPAPQTDGTYAEVPDQSSCVTDDTYEPIPGENEVTPSNTYETLEELKTKNPKSTWGKNNIKWRKFFS